MLGLSPPSPPPPLPPPQVASLEPATHAYTFWEGIPHEARASFGQLFARSRTLRVGARLPPPARLLLPPRLLLHSSRMPPAKGRPCSCPPA